MKRISIISLPFILLFFSCPVSGPTPPAQSGEFLNVSYGTHARNKMDVYLCKNREPNAPTIIFIHGGGFVEGDKSDFSQFASGAADYGLNGVTMNYRLAHDATYLQMLDDIAAAIDFLRSKKTEYNCNFEKISLYGASAGGGLALLYSYKCGGIHSAISLAGPTDFTDPELAAMHPEYAVNYLWENLLPEGDKEYYKADASPITYAKKSDNPYRNTTTLLFHGKDDTVVPCTQSEKLFEVIESLNPKNKKCIFDNCDHDFLGDEVSNTIVVETLEAVK